MGSNCLLFAFLYVCMIRCLALFMQGSLHKFTKISGFVFEVIANVSDGIEVRVPLSFAKTLLRDNFIQKKIE